MEVSLYYIKIKLYIKIMNEPEHEIAVPNNIPSSSIQGARKVGSDGKFEGPFIKNTNFKKDN